MSKNNPFECDGKCPDLGCLGVHDHKFGCPSKIPFLSNCGLGKRTIETLFNGIKATKCLDSAVNFLRNNGVREGRALVLAGDTGVGKTVAAGYILQQSCLNGTVVIATDLQSAFLKKDRLGKLKTAPLLIIDDLGMEFGLEFFESHLDGLFHARHMDERATVITTNLSWEKFQEKYSKRICSRLREWSVYVHIIDQDMRKK